MQLFCRLPGNYNGIMDGGNMDDVQKRIHQLMEARGWTEYKLAKAADLSQSTVSHLFKRNNAPTYSTMKAVCRAFGITMAQFFAEEGEPVVLTPEQQEWLRLWGTLNNEQRQIIKSTIGQFNRDE